MQEDDTIKVARHLGGIIYNIQEDISIWTTTTVHKFFQLTVKVEEKNKKKIDINFKR